MLLKYSFSGLHFYHITDTDSIVGPYIYVHLRYFKVKTLLNNAKVKIKYNVMWIKHSVDENSYS